MILYAKPQWTCRMSKKSTVFGLDFSCVVFFFFSFCFDLFSIIATLGFAKWFKNGASLANIWNSDFNYCHFPYCSVSFIILASVVYITQILPNISHLISVSLNLLYLCSDCSFSRYLQCSCSHSSSLFRNTFPERSALTTLLMSPLTWLVCTILNLFLYLHL